MMVRRLHAVIRRAGVSVSAAGNGGHACCSVGAVAPGSSACCAPEGGNTKKELAIDFLYLDLNTCERCMSTDSTLDEAIRDVAAVLEAAGFALTLNKIHIATRKMAEDYGFLSSPTIRINGTDIMMDVRESNCRDCGDICGDSVDCRVWDYEGVEYTEPPKPLIINAILRAIYGGVPAEHGRGSYKMPDNLVKFFDNIEKGTAE